MCGLDALGNRLRIPYTFLNGNENAKCRYQPILF